MRIKFIGAAGGSVTGSCTHFHYVRTNTNFLVDCGLVQGEGDFESINATPFPFDASLVQFVLLTHAHLDHCGLLPKLYRAGFTGEVICTAATAKLARMSLLDGANYPGSLFTKDEVKQIRFKPIEDNPGSAQAAVFPVRKDLFVSFRRTAHIVGSCSVTICWLDDQDQRRYVQMSGDLGNNTKENLYQPLLGHRRSIFGFPDAIVVESTYGNRTRRLEHKSFESRMEALRSLLQQEVFDRKALLIIPAFALQRTHEVLIDLYIVLSRFFADEAKATAPYLTARGTWQHFVDGAWTKFAHSAITRAIENLPPKVQAAWDDAFEATDDDTRPFRLRPGHSKTLEEVRALVEVGRKPYPVDIYLDSKLARSMGAVIRQELLRRSAHNHDELAHRNPELMTRLGIDTEEELGSLLAKLMPDPDVPSPPVHVGPHTIQYVDSMVAPGRSKRAERGSILITGGGMCEGGPVVSHLEKVAIQDSECVLVQTGFMARHSLGARLVQLIEEKQTEQDEKKSSSFISIGSKNQIPATDIHLRTVDISPFYSGHADQDGLLDFVRAADGRVPASGKVPAAKIFINHGNPAARLGLKTAIEERVKAAVVGDRTIDTIELPEADLQAFDLALGQWVTEDQKPSLEQLLSSLLREQVKTNELLRQLVNARTHQYPAKVQGKQAKTAKS